MDLMCGVGWWSSFTQMAHARTAIAAATASIVRARLQRGRGLLLASIIV